MATRPQRFTIEYKYSKDFIVLIENNYLHELHSRSKANCNMRINIAKTNVMTAVNTKVDKLI